MGWLVALLPRWGTRCSRWVLPFLPWVGSSPLAPCVLGLRHPLVSTGTIRPDGRSRRVPPCSPGQQGRGTPRSPRGMGARALRCKCPGSSSLGLTGSLLSLLFPRTPSPRACPWKRCLFWSASAKLLPLLTVKNMGPGEETGSETDGGRGGAAGSPRCRSPRGGGERAGHSRAPFRSLGPSSQHRPVRAEGTPAGNAWGTRPPLPLADTVF